MATSNQAPGLAQVLWMEVEKQSFSNQEQVGNGSRGRALLYSLCRMIFLAGECCRDYSEEMMEVRKTEVRIPLGGSKLS